MGLFISKMGFVPYSTLNIINIFKSDFMKEDLYKNFRDKRGRFIKGNPGNPVGRPKGSYSWLTENEFKEKYKFLNVVVPSSCPDCGGLEYRFNVRWDNNKAYSICARCNNCDRRRWYKPYIETWSEL